MSNSEWLTTARKRPATTRSASRPPLSICDVSRQGTYPEQSVRIATKKVVNNFSGRTISTHQGIDLGIERPSPGFTKSKRRKHRNRVASLKDPDYRNVTGACCWSLDWLMGEVRLDRHLKGEAVVFIRSHDEPFRYYFS